MAAQTYWALVSPPPPPPRPSPSCGTSKSPPRCCLAACTQSVGSSRRRRRPGRTKEYNRQLPRTTLWTLVTLLRITTASTSPSTQQYFTGHNTSQVTVRRVTDDSDSDTNQNSNDNSQTRTTHYTHKDTRGRQHEDNVTYARDDDELMRRDLSDAIQYGVQMMEQLILVKEPQLYKLGLYLNENDPAYRVATFGSPQKAALMQSKYGYAAIQAKLQLMEKLAQSRQNPDHDIFKRATIFDEQCPLRGVPRCTAASRRYRTSDGTCNNPDQPWKGASMLPFQRFLHPEYEDGVQSIRRSINGAILPSARDISVIVHRDRDIEMDTVTMMFVQWGQFLDHDITSTAQSRAFEESVPRCCDRNGLGFLPPELEHPSCLPIPVSTEDPFFGRFGLRCMEFVRSAPSSRINCKLSWREQINQVTSYIDASTVYGSDTAKADSLRTFENGLLRYGRSGQLNPPDPPNGELCRLGAISTQCFIGGDARVGEQPALTAFHTVWLRYHNRVAATMAGINRHWSDEKVYQETRRIIGAMVQHISYREFLPIVLGQEVMELFGLNLVRKGYYTGFDSSVNVAPANAFSTAAFRFGHSLVQRSFMRADRNHRRLFNNVSIHEESSNFDNIFSFASLDRLLMGFSNQLCQRRDEFISSELTNHLFQSGSNPFGMDLAAINIQRGRDHGIPSYTAWRVPCDLAPVTSWRDLEAIMTFETVQRFKALYQHVEDIDLYSGGLAERPVRGGLVGPTFACIIAQQFMNLRRGDRFWYENGDFESSFTPAQLQSIRRISFAEILCQTLPDVETIQPFVFLTPDNFRNARVLCNSPDMNTFNLDAFTEKLTFNRPQTEFTNTDNFNTNSNNANNNFNLNDNFIDRLDVAASSFEPFNKFTPTRHEIPINVNHKLDLNEDDLSSSFHKVTPTRHTIPINVNHKLDFDVHGLSSKVDNLTPTIHPTSISVNDKLDLDNDKFKIDQLAPTIHETSINVNDKLDLDTDDLTRKSQERDVTRPVKIDNLLGFNITTTNKTDVNDNLDFGTDKKPDIRNQEIRIEATTKATVSDLLDFDTDVIFLSPSSTSKTKKDTDRIDSIFDRRKREILYFDDDDSEDDYYDVIVETKENKKKKKRKPTTRRPQKQNNDKIKDTQEAPIKIHITNVSTASISIDENFDISEHDELSKAKYKPQHYMTHRPLTTKPPRRAYYQNNKYYGTYDQHPDNDQFVLHPTYSTNVNNPNNAVTHLVGTVNRQTTTPRTLPHQVNINIQYVLPSTPKPPKRQTAYPIKPNNFQYMTRPPGTTNKVTSYPILIQENFGGTYYGPSQSPNVEIYNNNDYYKPMKLTTKRPLSYLDDLYPQTNKVPYKRPTVSYFNEPLTYQSHRPRPNTPGHVFTNNQYDYTSTTTSRPATNYYYTQDNNDDAVIISNKPVQDLYGYDVPVVVSNANGYISSGSFMDTPFSTSKKPYIYKPSSSYYSMFQDIYSTTTSRPRPLYVNSYVEKVTTPRPPVPNYLYYNSDSTYKDDPIRDVYSQILTDDKQIVDFTNHDHKLYYIGNKPFKVPIDDKIDLKTTDRLGDQGEKNFVKISSIRGNKFYNLNNKDPIINVAQNKEGDYDLIIDDIFERSGINDHIDFGLEDKVQIDVIPKENREDSWHIFEEIENITLPVEMGIVYCKDKDSCSAEVPKPMTISDKLLTFET